MRSLWGERGGDHSVSTGHRIDLIGSLASRSVGSYESVAIPDVSSVADHGQTTRVPSAPKLPDTFKPAAAHDQSHISRIGTTPCRWNTHEGTESNPQDGTITAPVLLAVKS